MAPPFWNTFRQLENLKYWRNFDGVHEKREFRFLTEKMSSILNLSLVFSDQLGPEWERRNQSLPRKKQTHASLQEMLNIYTFTENGFFASFSTILYLSLESFIQKVPLLTWKVLQDIIPIFNAFFQLFAALIHEFGLPPEN